MLRKKLLRDPGPWVYWEVEMSRGWDPAACCPSWSPAPFLE